LLVPRASLLPWPRSWTPIRRIALPLIALLLSFVVAAQLLGGAWIVVTLGGIAVSVIALMCIGRRWGFAVCLLAVMLSHDGWATVARSAEGVRTRSDFGIYKVNPSADGEVRQLTHGTTLHGSQHMDPARETRPISYYTPKSGVGLTLGQSDLLLGEGAGIGVVGLGAGTLACYAQPDQTWTFFEIDPAMVEIAHSRFTFLSRCAPRARVVVGDARLRLLDEPDGSMNLLIVDAFSSDAVPMHLLTREALRVYGEVVESDGIVLFHISNRYLNLEPVVAGLAEEEQWIAVVRRHVPGEEDRGLNAVTSEWVALSRSPGAIERLRTLSGDTAQWEAMTVPTGFAGWSDDHASLLPLIRWARLWGG
jgi:SAM-dependent methyltransferase